MMKPFAPWRRRFLLLVSVHLWCMALCLYGAEAGRRFVSGNVPPRLSNFVSQGLLPANTNLSLAIGLPLRNAPELKELLRQLQDPASTNYHCYLSPEQFTERFGPTEEQYASVIQFARDNGFTVVRTHRNRVVLDVQASSGDIERAFAIRMRTFRHPTEPRNFYAPDSDPSVPTNLPITSIEGLSDYWKPRPLLRPIKAGLVKALSGSGPSGWYRGNDFRNAYVPGTTLTGKGQSVGLLEFSGYYQSDVTNYEGEIGLTNFVPLVDVVPHGPGISKNNNAEVALDIEVAIAMAPGLSQVIVYEDSGSASSILSQMVNDNRAKQLSSSWSWSGGPNSTIDSLFQQMAAQGQSFFQASGDSDAYTGGNLLDNSSATVAPVDSPYITSVGGTTLNMNGLGLSWSSEKVWNYHSLGGTSANVGSSGGISQYYSIPSWQTSVSMANNSGSATMRNIPDVALTGDNVYVRYNNGSSGGFAGTSCAAPLWAGLCALINEKSLATGGSAVGFLNPALYQIANSSSYSSCFHDITSGNNVGTNTPGLYNAVTGYDLCTGLGTPNGIGLINALVPFPDITSSAASQTVTNGDSAVFRVSATGQAPLSYRWFLDGNSLADTGNISGATSNALTLTTVTTNDAGNYSVVVSNSLGAVTSAVATLTVVSPPSITSQPADQIVSPGDTAMFSATVTGASPLSFRWQKDGTDLADGPDIFGAASDTLELSNIAMADAGSYQLIATNIYGSSTSSVASLTIIEPPTVSLGPAQTIQCGGSANFSATATGTAPLGYQWTLDNSQIPGATNATLSLTNVHLPDHTIAVVVTNLYGSATDSVTLTVQDTLAPIITLNGGSPIFSELGNSFTDPGATASDACAGAVPVSVLGTVNTSAVGTNTLIYTATDGNGNTNSLSRTVIVQDTTPPGITWSFTNLTLVADTNCSAMMPDVTGTNFILATDLSEPLAITQVPTNGASLTTGSNVVILAVSDAFGNVSYSTNSVVVQDETPPALTLIGNDPLYLELGQAFTDPGASATDTCAGAVTVTVSGTVNTNAIGTNTLNYTADDGNGNTNGLTRTVIVQDTTPPSVTWIATNLVLAADTNCTAIVPDLTTTNFVLATDLSGPLSFEQTPTNGAVLAEGSNLVVLAVSDAYGNTSYSTNALVVKDETPPEITLLGSDPVYLELGNSFADPGATASDTCAGIVPVMVIGIVNTNAAGTNTLTYIADDGNGNTNSLTRTVIVQDTTPPLIAWSFTNLTIAADTNCAAILPDLTGTNFISATDLSLPLTISQEPTNGTVLSEGSNTVVLAVSDSQGNTSYSTNLVVVADQSPPRIWTQPSSQTNDAGSAAILSVVATDCSPLKFQWYFDDAALPGETNSLLTLSNLNSTAQGNYFVIANAVGGSTTSAVATLTVQRLPASLALASSVNPAGFKSTVAFLATVSAQATGSITFLTNGTILDLVGLAGGAASLTNNVLPRGTNEITAIYGGDSVYLPATNTLFQTITNHPPIAMAFFTNRYAGFSLSIPVSTLASNWSDPDEDQLSLASVATSSNGVIITNENGNLIYSATNNLDDSFGCTITDGWGGITEQTVNITVLPPPGSSIQSAINGTNGWIVLTLSGSSGFTYVLEATTNLETTAEWIPIATNQLGPNGIWQFSESVTNNSLRFYRLELAK